MSKNLSVLAFTVSTAAISCIYATPSLANNGFYLNGYGFESSMMGGADVAVARDAFAATNNPAGMTQLVGQAAELEVAAYDSMGSHTDSFGNYRKPFTNWLGGYANGAYARHFENSSLAAGVAMVVQGGLGTTYRGLNTQFGGRDDASATFATLKLAPAIAWEVNDQLSLGATLGINYFGASQELFPNTSASPSPSLPTGFPGIRFKGASGIGLNSKWGLQYRPAKDVTIGVTYGTQTSIPLKGGNLRINFSNPAFGGLGTVRYDNAKMTGLRLPEELAFGIAFRPTERLLVSLQDKWYNWSDAIKTLQITASNPRTPGAPPTVVIPSAIDFVDQHVIEIGIAYDFDKNNTFLAGINHGSRPIPDNNVSPIFAPIQARFYTFGVKHKINEEWYSAVGVEAYGFQSVTYDSPIFGPRANERHTGFVVHMAVGRNW